VFEILSKPFAGAPIASAPEVFARLLIAWILGVGVARVYRTTRVQNDILPTFPGTLVLLSILIAMVTQVIGDNIARAFSLVGALSIVRFRTVVRDTQDTAFVIVAVVVGMAAGAGDLIVAGMGIVIVSAAAFLMKPRPTQGGREARLYLVRLRVSLGHEVEALVGTTLDAHLADRSLVSMSTARQGTAVEASYQGRVRRGTSVEACVKALNRLEGVQRVDVGIQRATDVRE